MWKLSHFCILSAQHWGSTLLMMDGWTNRPKWQEAKLRYSTCFCLRELETISVTNSDTYNSLLNVSHYPFHANSSCAGGEGKVSLCVLWWGESAEL